MPLTARKLNRLEFLSKSIPRCNKCSRIRKNGIAIPYWTNKSKYLILAEAPGEEEVFKENQTPLVGRAGRFLFTSIKTLFGISREECFIINVINCRPVENGKNGKPRPDEIENCSFWIKHYLNTIKPSSILALGNYANRYFFEDAEGITHETGMIKDLDGIKIVPCLHPAYVLYNSSEKKAFFNSLKVYFREVNN